MRSLFGRIFLWFCATVFCGIVLGHIVGPYLERPREMERVRKGIQRITTLAGTALVDLYERQGPDALAAQLRYEDPMVDIYVFDATGTTELTGRDAPQAARDYASGRVPTPEQAERTGGPDPTGGPGPPGPMPMVRDVRSSSGLAYRVVFFPAHQPSRTEFLLSRLTDPRLYLFFAAGVIFSLLLARSLTAPLRRLRASVKRLGRGDLSIRTGGGSRWDHKEIGELADEFDRMAERVETLMASHKRLLRDISHELRSPLTRINVALDLARQRCGEPAAGSLSSIATDAARMESLIDQMLTLSRLDAQDEQPPEETVNLGALAMQALRNADIEAHGRGVAILASRIEPVLVRGSEELLRRAVENVVRNALVHSPEGTEVMVSLGAAIQDGCPWAELVVRDNGFGVPEQELESIFEPYYRTSGKSTGKGSMGLGLAITRRAVRLHGGEVCAANSALGGLEVSIRLPALHLPDREA